MRPAPATAAAHAQFTLGSLQLGNRQHTMLSCGNPQSRELVLFLHGFPDTEASFTAQLQALADAGYFAVAVRLRGYEPTSQSASGDYSVSALADDVFAMADALGFQRFHLVGHDWGATIAYAAAAADAQRLLSLSVLSVPHPGAFEKAIAKDSAQLRRSWYVIFFQLPKLPEWWLQRAGQRGLASLYRAWSPQWSQGEAALAPVRSAFAKPGVTQAALAYYRAGRDRKSPQAQRSRQLLTADIRVPTLALHGEDDGCIGKDIFKAALPLAQFPRGLKIVAIPAAGHFVHREQPGAVNAQLLDFIGKHALRAS